MNEFEIIKYEDKNNVIDTIKLISMFVIFTLCIIILTNSVISTNNINKIINSQINILHNQQTIIDSQTSIIYNQQTIINNQIFIVDNQNVMIRNQFILSCDVNHIMYKICLDDSNNNVGCEIYSDSRCNEHL